MTQEYECVEVHEEGYPHYYAVLRGGGDEVRLACPPHEFGKFVLGERYRLTVERVGNDACK